MDARFQLIDVTCLVASDSNEVALTLRSLLELVGPRCHEAGWAVDTPSWGFRDHIETSSTLMGVLRFLERDGSRRWMARGVLALQSRALAAATAERFAVRCGELKRLLASKLCALSRFLPVLRRRMTAAHLSSEPLPGVRNTDCIRHVSYAQRSWLDPGSLAFESAQTLLAAILCWDIAAPVRPLYLEAGRSRGVKAVWRP